MSLPIGVLILFANLFFLVNSALASPAKIVLDPGHGGENKGAPCDAAETCFEKELTLPIALLTEKYLRQQGAEVYLTRRSDVEVGISERVQFANQLGADVLVSIHLNASDRVGPSGFMTFALSHEALDQSEARLMQFEALAPASLRQATSQRLRSSDLEDILFDLTVDRGQKQSAYLAHHLQKALREASSFPDQGVRQAPFHVLLGASMPAVVCELGFLNHPREGQFLRSAAGQNALALALADGILTFLNDSKRESKELNK